MITIFNNESRWFDGLDGYLIYFLVLVGVVIAGIINIEMIVSWVQNYRKKKAKKRAERYLDNGDEQVENEISSREDLAINRELYSDWSQSMNQNQNMIKSIKQSENWNIQNENQVEDDNAMNESR